jgi:glycosyltransferase involved in cell wall biosynthesis
MVAACPFPANWGTPGAIRELSITLAAQGHDVHVVTYPYGEDLPIGDVKVSRLKYFRRTFSLFSGPSCQKIILDILLLFQLCKVIRRERIDVIHAHNYEGVLIGVLAKFITGRPLVYNAVSLMANELSTYNFIRPRFVAQALAVLLDWFVPKFPDYFIAVSPDLENWLLDEDVSPHRISMIPCGIRPELFAHADPERVRERHQLNGRPIVMYTGIISPLQEIDKLINAFAAVHARCPEALLLMVSPLAQDRGIDRYRPMAEALGIDDSIRWIQDVKLEQLPDYIAAATVTTIPRLHVAGHAIKLLNYMALGKPTVCFAGAAKGVSHLRDAYIVKGEDWHGLADGILELLNKPALAATIAANAHDTVMTSFDWNRLALNVTAVYESLLPGIGHQIAHTATLRSKADSE